MEREEGGKKVKTHYQVASAVLKELVDRDLGFIIMLILHIKSQVFLEVKLQLSLYNSHPTPQIPFAKAACFKNPGFGECILLAATWALPDKILNSWSSFAYSSLHLRRHCLEVTLFFSSALHCRGGGTAFWIYSPSRSHGNQGSWKSLLIVFLSQSYNNRFKGQLHSKTVDGQ